MKTNITKSQISDRTLLRSEQQIGKNGNRETEQTQPSISLERRRANRGLRSNQLLSLLRRDAPLFFERAEVVGQWVWIQFNEKQPPGVTRLLSEFGFHWNNRRQIWQHPCGTFLGIDPRRKYHSYFPADTTNS